MPLINCQINLLLTWSANFITLSNAAAYQATTFKITDTNHYAIMVTLPTQDNTNYYN